MKRDLHFEAVYPQPIEKVWQALTNPEALAAWLMPNTFEPRVGHRFQFRTKPAPGFDGVVRCTVLEVEAPSRLVYSWAGGGIDTKLIWTLAPIPEGTRLILDHTGFAGIRGLLVSAMLGKGWGSRILFQRLPALLEQWSGAGPIPDGWEAGCHR